ncbi:MAG TPA: FAA hydrolase family protein [Kiritimatiellae bacterium]|nr:FAA hydrolase family protein [Kiritimatiellia bacterium]
MKLVRFGPPGRERPGIWVEEEDGSAAILDVTAVAFDIHEYDSHFFTHWGLERLRGIRDEHPAARIPADGVRLGPPVPPPTNLVCVGLNYASHAAELGLSLPKEPLLFAKAPTAVIGPSDPILLPRAARVDFEVELAIVLSRPCHRVAAEDARNYIAGYTILNDLTDRWKQQGVSQWYLAKSHPGFCPLGPWLVTADELDFPPRVRLSSWLNGETFQHSDTSDMIFPPAEIVSYASFHLRLNAGDIISTGTPAGIGSRRSPAVFLNPGDHLRLEIEGLGVQENRVVADSSVPG